MNTVRIPKRYKRQISRLSEAEKVWIFESLFELVDGENVEIPDNFAGDILELIWRDSIQMESKNRKFDRNTVGECVPLNFDLPPTMSAGMSAGMSRTEGKGKEGKGKEEKGSVARGLDGYLNSDEFEEFWNLYPKQTAKPIALSAWNEVVSDPVEALKKFKIAIDWQAKSESYFKNEHKYQPSPEKYIRGERWNDAAPAEEKPKKTTQW